MYVNPSVYAYNVSDTFLPHLLICYGHVWDYLDNPGDDAVFANERSGGTSLLRATRSGDRTSAEDDGPQESNQNTSNC